jgi:hypothetical protein
MSRITFALLLSLVLLNACGGGNSGGMMAAGRADVIDGTWSAAFSGPAPTYNFNATLAQSSGTNVDVTSLAFAGPVFCFTGFRGESATFTSSGLVNGNITGQFTLSVTTLFPGPDQNVLTLQGNVTGRQIVGTWMVTGNVPGVPPGSCPLNSGTFTMTKTG